MTAMAMRAARREDLPALVALLADDDHGREREHVSDPLLPAYVEAFEAIDRDPTQMLAIAEQDGNVIGTLHLRFLPGLSYQGGWKGQIEAVRIAAPLRGGGLGTELIGWAVEQCQARGCKIVQLSSNSTRGAAHRFYERLGFVASHVGMKLYLEGEH
jgi:GNAT superfamily N-acetyltransferase